MFLHLSVSHSVHRGGYLGRYTPHAGTPPWAGTSQGQVQPRWAGTPQAGTPLGRQTPTPWASTPPGRYTPWQVHPLAGTLPRQVHPPHQAGTPPGQVQPPTSSACWEIRATSGRYASYWNAFLF